MVRQHLHIQVRLGRGGEYYKVFEGLAQNMRAKKLPPSRLWNPVSGKINHFVIVTEFESLAAYDAGIKSLQTDPEFMSLWRGSLDLLAEAPWDELWETTIEGA
jgi:hypothetical protein